MPGLLSVVRFQGSNTPKGSQVTSSCMGVEPKIGGFYPQNGWFIMDNPIKIQ